MSKAFYPGCQFPVNVLPAPIEKACHDAFDATQAPLGLIATIALGVVSSGCQGVIDVVQPTGQRSPCATYGIVIAESGEGKTTVQRLLDRGIRRFEAAAIAKAEASAPEREAEMLAWRAKLDALKKLVSQRVTRGEDDDDASELLKAHSKLRPIELLTPKLTILDVTTEALSRTLIDKWPYGSFMADEGGGALNGRATRDLALLNRLWDGEPLHIDRTSGSVSSKVDPRLTVLFQLQPGQFEKFCENRGGEAMDIGFFARTLATFPASTQGARERGQQERSTPGLDAFDARVFSILEESERIVCNAGKGRKLVVFSDEAKTRWNGLAAWIEAEIGVGRSLSSSRAYASKMGNNIARLAALFQYFETGELVISSDILRRAIDVGNWYLSEHMRMFSPLAEIPQDQQDARVLDDWLLKRSDSIPYGMSIRSLRQRCPNALRSRDRLDAAVDWLHREGKVIVALNGKTRFLWINWVYYNQSVANNAVMSMDRYIHQA